MASPAPLRWGVLGTGRIAREFAAAIYAAPDNEIAMIAGRSPERTKEMADIYGGRSTTTEGLGAYTELARDPDVDVIYIATYQNSHFEHIMLCLSHGKHVLCEKPMCMNALEVRAVVTAAKAKGLFFMEGHWTHCWPAAKEAARLVEEGVIGDLVSVSSDFTFASATNLALPEFQNKMGGGVTQLAGVYPLCAVVRYLGKPSEVKAIGYTEQGGDDGGHVDTAATIVMRHEGNRFGQATYGWKGEGAQETVINGTKGFIVLRSPGMAPTHVTVNVAVARNTYETREIEFEIPKHPEGLPPIKACHPRSEGMLFEVLDAAEAIRAGAIECPAVPHQVSINLAETVDEILAQIGVVYPQTSVSEILANIPEKYGVAQDVAAGKADPVVQAPSLDPAAPIPKSASVAGSETDKSGSSESDAIEVVTARVGERLSVSLTGMEHV
mmetsp:Transcript_13056/g.44249  ORF Transcript_13056/g.44249 Transcript_13056/m.44249 type:complete len:440 (+) Transcript_13056:86-1405(+)